MPLRDYQQALISQASRRLSAGARRIMLQAPTGTGKGNIISHLALSAARAGQRSVVSAPRREIILDLVDRMSGRGHDVGVLAPWARPNPDALIQVASDMTLPRRLDKIQEPDWYFPDECHHTPAASYAPVFDQWTAARTVGLTATPWRLDGQGFDHIFDDLITSAPARWFMDEGYLVEPDIYCPSVPDLARLGGGRGDYRAGDLEEALEKSGTIGDAIKSFSKYVRPDGVAIAFCVSVSHAEKTNEIFNAAGIPSEILLGDDSGKEREAKLERLKRGITRVITSVDTLGEGTDVPVLDAVILLRPTKSLSLFIQQIGRALRPVYAPGYDLDTQKGRLAAIAASSKPRAVVLDHSGNVLRHGHPASPRDEDWLLGPRDAQKRSQSLSEAGEDLSVRQCLECFGVHEAAPVCPYCGHEHPVDQRIPRWKAGELKKIEQEEIEAQRKKKRKEEQGEKTLEDWLRIAEERGYKKGWAYQRHKLRQQKRRTR